MLFIRYICNVFVCFSLSLSLSMSLDFSNFCWWFWLMKSIGKQVKWHIQAHSRTHHFVQFPQRMRVWHVDKRYCWENISTIVDKLSVSVCVLVWQRNTEREKRLCKLTTAKTTYTSTKRYRTAHFVEKLRGEKKVCIIFMHFSLAKRNFVWHQINCSKIVPPALSFFLPLSRSTLFLALLAVPIVLRMQDVFELSILLSTVGCVYLNVYVCCDTYSLLTCSSLRYLRIFSVRRRPFFATK